MERFSHCTDAESNLKSARVRVTGPPMAPASKSSAPGEAPWTARLVARGWLGPEETNIAMLRIEVCVVYLCIFIPHISPYNLCHPYIYIYICTQAQATSPGRSGGKHRPGKDSSRMPDGTFKILESLGSKAGRVAARQLLSMNLGRFMLD